MKIRISLILAACFAALLIAYWPPNGVTTMESARSGLAERSTAPEESTASQRLAEEWVRLKSECLSIYGSEEPGSDHILSEDGSLDRAALSRLGVNPGKFPSIDAAIREARLQMQQSFLSRTQIDPLRSDATKGVEAYTVVSDRSFGDGVLKKLHEALVEACGTDQGHLLYRSLSPGKQFGCFGRQELRFQIKSRNSDAGSWEVAVQAIEPVTRMKIESFTITHPDRLKFSFGEAIQISDH